MKELHKPQSLVVIRTESEKPTGDIANQAVRRAREILARNISETRKDFPRTDPGIMNVQITI